ncbi:Uncharacterized protein TCAP_03159 [Tolypocladium capitatum]|uniref:Uncharacterized protein n=1 Tax=Tolypocladium capitatum TaxID=45235 RepID=A0A2K3QHC2_9HYPO|nr:Uncharacterized protein TCAP_03159 [Tolypocladium capitatum]
MGMHGPLTAQGLGRSPYDDVVEGEGDDDTRQPSQLYDYHGRPVNPETRRVNRDIVRSHNEVMLVIGVAEPENPFAGPEAESQRRHEAYEKSIGLRLASSARRCIESVGLFGVHGLRQRILIYKRYSQIPFWELYQAARKDFSVSREILAGAPTGFLTNYVEQNISRLWAGDKHNMLARRCIHEIWSYIRVHLELYAALQRLGLTPSRLLLPSPKFFVPFTDESPMPPLTAPEDFTLPSLLRWIGGVFVSTTPFLVWVMAQRTVHDMTPRIWTQVFKRLPNTLSHAIPPPPLLPPPPPPPPPPTIPHPLNDNYGSYQENFPEGHNQHGTNAPPLQDADHHTISQPGSVDAIRRSSIYSTRGDDYASDDENEGVSATLISFDVEATESTDAPPGLWSAELRPSLAPESRSNAAQPPVYANTLLTQLPALFGSYILTDAITRILVVPYEASALRLVGRTLLLRRGRSCQGIYSVNLLSGISWTSAVNFFGTELLHLVLCVEVWAVFTSISQWFHMTEEEWKAEEGKG